MRGIRCARTKTSKVATRARLLFSPYTVVAETFSAFRFINRNIIISSFNLSGTLPVLMDLLKMLDNIGAKALLIIDELLNQSHRICLD